MSEPARLPARRLPIGIQILELQRTLGQVEERLQNEHDASNATVASAMKSIWECRVKLSGLRLLLDVIFHEDDAGTWSHEEQA